jgi:hypothetical protein
MEHNVVKLVTNPAIRMLWAVTILAAACLISGCLKPFTSDHDDIKVKDLERLVVEVPAPVTFEEVGSRSYSTLDRAGIYKAYSSGESYHDVKRYYSEVLGAKGWVFDGEDRLSNGEPSEDGGEFRFRKGELLIAVQYEGAHKLRDGRNYTVSFVWRAESQ